MKTLEFFIPLRKIPDVTAQEQRTGVRKDGSTYRYDPQELKEVKQLFRDHLAQHAPSEPLTGPVYLSVTWLYPATGDHKPGEWKTTKPDTDNLIKLFKDQMTKVGFWKDDAQVCQELNNKLFNDVCGIAVQVEQLPPTIREFVDGR